MNKYQKKIHKEIKAYMDYFTYDNYVWSKWCMKYIYGKGVCNNCKNSNCVNRDKVYWCKDKFD